MLRLGIGLILVVGLAATGCHTVAWHSAEVSGTGQRLVGGASSGFLTSNPRIWVYENGECHPVEIEFVEE